LWCFCQNDFFFLTGEAATDVGTAPFPPPLGIICGLECALLDIFFGGYLAVGPLNGLRTIFSLSFFELRESTNFFKNEPNNKEVNQIFINLF